MDFKDTILQLAGKIEKQKEAIQTEEATKNAFIMPMIAALGYDIFNPFEVVPEMDCDLTKKGDKLDYAIMKDNETILLIECKHCKQKLDLHSTQLSKYYAASNARFGVLTNGIEYRFYTDLEKTNIMDEKPFLIIDILDLSDADIEQIKKFHKSYYNESEILSTAQELKYTTEIKKIISSDFASPSNDYVRFITKQVYDGAVTFNVIQQFAPIIKKAVNAIVNDIIQDRLELASKTADHKQQDEIETHVEITKEKIDAYNIIKEVLKNSTGVEMLIFQDYKSYFLVAIENKYWGVCRIKVKNKKVYIYFPNENYSSYEKVGMESINGIYKHTDRLKKSFKTALKLREEYINKHTK